MPDDDPASLRESEHYEAAVKAVPDDREPWESCRAEIIRLRHEIDRLKHEGTCRYAGPGRGDCEHFVGLPGQSIPGQHDGEDDTVDVYGKPNGWCWHCWLMHQRDDLQRELRVSNGEVERLQVQLAGCLTAAEGATSPRHVALPGDYGWSPAYEAVLQLRLAHNDLSERFDQIIGLEPEAEEEGAIERPSRWAILGGDDETG